ncbi:MAG: hypothetical protein ACI8VE_001483 [Natrialbaceae archaeon]|jgi:hypothetical protein
MERLPHDVTAPTTATKAAVVAILFLLVAAIGSVVVSPALGGPDAEPKDDGAVSVVVENVSGERTVTVTYSTSNGTSQFTVEDVDPALVNRSENWAYLPRSTLPDTLERVAGNHTAGVVTAGEWVLVGDLNGAFAREGTASVWVVSPAGMDADPGRKAWFLAEFAGQYELASNDTDPVSIIIAPDALPSAGLMYEEGGYVTQHAFWDGKASSVWIHEYVHAKRNVSLAGDMRWFSEASATYFSMRMLEEQYEGVTEADVRERLAALPEHEDTPLSSRTAWDDTHADYDRGTKLLYVVDAAIRTGSDGEYTLLDVFRELNRRDGPVTVDEFVRIVEHYSGNEEEWLRRAITQGGDLDPMVEGASDAFED